MKKPGVHESISIANFAHRCPRQMNDVDAKGVWNGQFTTPDDQVKGLASGCRCSNNNDDNMLWVGSRVLSGSYIGDGVNGSITTVRSSS